MNKLPAGRERAVEVEPEGAIGERDLGRISGRYRFVSVAQEGPGPPAPWERLTGQLAAVQRNRAGCDEGVLC